MGGPEARMIATWRAPLEGGKSSEELLVCFDKQRSKRILVIPALFDEANKMRRFTVQMMRALDANGADCFLPDLPGCNESLVPLENQTLESWRKAIEGAVQSLSISHIFSIRGGALLAPPSIPGWQYSPLSGQKILRSLIRARTIASKESGQEEDSQQLLERGRNEGLVLAGWPIGATMLRELEGVVPTHSETQHIIQQKDVSGAGLWLRAEPGEDSTGAEALAAIVAGEKGSAG